MRAKNTGNNEGFCSECDHRALPGQTVCADHLGSLAVPEVPTIKEVSAKSAPVVKTVTEETYETYDIVAEGAKRAVRLIAEEEEARLRFWKEQQERSPGGKLKKRPPLKMSAKRPRRDMTMMRDPDTGENLAPAHMACRWVRETDNYGNPSDLRMEQFKEDGYEVINTSSGDPLRSILGVAMKASLDIYAERIRVNTPSGALNRNALLADTDEAIKETNKRIGFPAVGLVKENDHHRGSYSDES